MNTQTKRKVRVTPETIVVAPLARFVQPAVFEAVTGYTVKAQERKREDGIWVEGKHWVKAPDGRVLMSIEGYNSWCTSKEASS